MLKRCVAETEAIIITILHSMYCSCQIKQINCACLADLMNYLKFFSFSLAEPLPSSSYIDSFIILYFSKLLVECELLPYFIYFLPIISYVMKRCFTHFITERHFIEVHTVSLLKRSSFCFTALKCFQVGTGSITCGRRLFLKKMAVIKEKAYG
jgi:hypothetical protein